jgi:SatD family protein
MTSVYIALIGDVIASRALPAPDRARLQRRLRAAIPDFNRRWRRSLAARFAVTLGDEWQCLLTSAAPIWEIAHVIRATLAEVEWVIACGRGPVTTPLARGVAAPEVDGPCFHEARAALDGAKRSRRLFGFRGFGPAEALLNGFASYYAALHWSWTPRQRHAAKLLRRGGRALVAEQLRVSPSAVSHLARRMAWPLVAAGDNIFRTTLGDAGLPPTTANR